MENADTFVATNCNGGLYITTFGKSCTAPGHFWGPAIHSYYLIHYITSGSGIFYSYSRHNPKYELHAGQSFLIEPSYVNRYESSQDDPWSYIWIGFSGEDAPGIIRHLGINQDSPIFSCSEPQGAKLIDYMNIMLQHKDNSIASSFRQLECLYGFFSVLAESVQSPIITEKNSGYMTQCIEYINTHLSEPFSVQDLADYMGLSRTYMTQLFKHNLQLSPQEYIIQHRLNRACRLLETTQLSIESIALQCGYVSNNTFSKSFQKNLLLSPTAYRQHCKKNNTYPNPKENQADIEK